MAETETTEKKLPAGFPWGCLVFLIGGLALIIFGWPTDAAKPWFYLAWGALLLGSLAFGRPAWLWSGRIDRRADPYRFWITLAAGVTMIGLSIYVLASG